MTLITLLQWIEGEVEAVRQQILDGSCSSMEVYRTRISRLNTLWEVNDRATHPERTKSESTEN